MTPPRPWTPIEPDLAAALRSSPEPLQALAAGEAPAIILRGAYPRESCKALMARLIARGLLYDPRLPVPEEFIAASIPEGYYREGLNAEGRRAWQDSPAAPRRRIDVGSSLGYRGSDPEAFFAHARETLKLFATLFDGLVDPLALIHESLSALSRTQRAVTAHEPDGRSYGPAIFRAHYGAYAYQPHFDSVRLREKRTDYAVHRFAHQFAGVLVLQNPDRDDGTPQTIIHRCFWEPEVQPFLDAGTFHDFARRRAIPSASIVLEPGDLYFFNTRAIHEVPGVAGIDPRVVLATFIGYTPGEEEMFVWS
jgi:hypothetical protein